MYGGRGSNMKSWFLGNTKGRKAAEDFIKKREKGSQESVRSLLLRMKKDYEFPFSSEPSLVRYLKDNGLGFVTGSPPVEEIDKDHSFKLTKERKAKINKAKKWVVTGAQNNTPPEPGFLKALEMFCEVNEAELIVRPIRYKNPTTNIVPDDSMPDGMWWHKSLDSYLVDEEIELRDVIIPDVRIQATAANPLTGLDARSGAKHGIYASTQLAMKTIATPQYKLPKILYGSGVVTVENYSTTKAGNLAEFHHSLSAVVIEQSDSTFIRAVSWNGESFNDLDKEYFPTGVCEAEPWAALVTGDEHAWFTDDNVIDATYTMTDSMVSVGKPEYIVRHDLLDCYSISHHHRGNTLLERNKEEFGWDCLETELEETIHFLNMTSEMSPDSVNVIVASNHGDHLTQWLQKGESAVSPKNALIYHKLKVAMFESAENTKTGVKMRDPFELYCEGKTDFPVKFLSKNEAFMVKGIDLHNHGHVGSNGAKGSAAGLSKIGVKTVAAHTHSPCIVGGCTQVGTSSFYDLEYCRGPSSWLQCHCIIHQDGKRQLIPIIEGQWRG